MVFNIRDTERKIITDLPREVEEINNIWIPMSDGTKLSAKMWIPKDAHENPVPALLEYIPYRKNDFTALRDSLRHPYFAGHGYASIRVDLRGSGDSEGILYDEYLKQEQDDALEVLDWISKQKWYKGGIGMFGKSWGGFNSLQVAARNHPHLKAIITLCSTDDRYADDVHYKGGAMLSSDMLWWASTMFVYNARPQDPKVVGEKWRENWLERMEKTPPFVEEWVRHQRRDAYWKHGSVCENYDDIKIPVFAVGGWADGYTNAVFRLLDGLSSPKLGLIGPWTHEYPEVAVPGPQIGFLQEALRWWDYWLKGKETGIMDEPMLRAYVQDGIPPKTYYHNIPGKWVGENNWKKDEQRYKELYLERDRLIDSAPEKTDEVVVTSAQQHGLFSGVFCPFGLKGEYPGDQRNENGYATLFTSEPLEEDISLLGFPKLKVEFSSDKPLANMIVRLNHLLPDGSSTRVSWGVLNLTHLNSHEFPEKLVPHQKYEATIELNAIGYTIPKGHRMEVAISPTYWPHIWPSPEEVNLTVYLNEKTKLLLPVREDKEIDKEITFEIPETCKEIERKMLKDASKTRKVYHDLTTGEWVLEDYSNEGIRKLQTNGIECGSENTNYFRIKEGDPLSASLQSDWVLYVGRDEWQTRLESTSKMTADQKHFHIYNHLIAYEGDEEVFNKEWKTSIPRDFI